MTRHNPYAAEKDAGTIFRTTTETHCAHTWVEGSDQCIACGETLKFERRVKVYIDPADWWIGYYRGPNHHYVCLLPLVVIRWARRDLPPGGGAS